MKGEFNVSIIPSSIADKTTLALEECVREAIEKIDFSQFMVAISDLAPENILAFIAQERHVLGKEGWNACETKQEKLALLNSAIGLHRKKGTVGAIKECLSVSGIKAQYMHWREYGGIPHYYKIALDFFNKKYDQEIEKALLERVEEFKQLRAKLEKVEISIGTTFESYISISNVVGEVVTVDFR